MYKVENVPEILYVSHVSFMDVKQKLNFEKAKMVDIIVHIIFLFYFNPRYIFMNV